ncbi:hypothetical protein [Spirosoma arcticum]
MNDLLNQLPEHDPRPDLWARIEADLTSDERLARAVGDLPTFEPKAHLWDDIPTDRRNTFTVIRPLWAGLAAAAVVVLVGVWLFLRPGNDESVRVEYAVETGQSIPSPDGVPSTADQRAEEFIRQQCAQQTLACQRPEVHELRNQLTDLTAEQERIEQERQTFGDDPRLVRAQVQIENQRADVTKELITLLRS